MSGEALLDRLTPLESALHRAVDAVEAEHLPYMVIGGSALNCWGYTRPTKDVDLAVWAEAGAEGSIASALAMRLPTRMNDAADFVVRSRVLLLKTEDGVGVDISFGALPFERESIARAVPMSIGGRMVRVASVPDLALQKAIAGRPRDYSDLRYLITRHAERIDRVTLDRMVSELAQALAQPEMLANYLRCWEGGQ